MVTAGMTPRDAVRQLEARLTAAGCPDADYDAAELFRLVTGRDVRLADAPLTEAQAARLESLCLRREAREPLQYLCGRWSFLDFELIVGPGVLCPRADTEVVAETAAQTLAGVKAPRVLDLCAGTGCLGLGVKRFCPDAQVTCVEKSPEAFRYLEQNVHTALPGAAPAVQAVQGDLFTYWQSLPEGQLDLIVSNPPYIAPEEMAGLQPELFHEPRMALEAPDGGLAFYKHIAPAYFGALKPGGRLILEIGWRQADAVCALCLSAGYEAGACRRLWPPAQCFRRAAARDLQPPYGRGLSGTGSGAVSHAFTGGARAGISGIRRHRHAARGQGGTPRPREHGGIARGYGAVRAPEGTAFEIRKARGRTGVRYFHRRDAARHERPKAAHDG